MFIRSVKNPVVQQHRAEYVRIVGSVRAENGKVKQKVIANLGRRDTLEAVLPLLNPVSPWGRGPNAAWLANSGEKARSKSWTPLPGGRCWWLGISLANWDCGVC